LISKGTRLAAGAVAALVLIGVCFLITARLPAGGPPNIILISIDTLRADHLECYGYDRETAPVICGLAKRSTLYERALAPSPYTLPSHVAMLTGRHPADVSIKHYESRLPAGTTIVAEPLKKAGYHTAAIVDARRNGFVGADRGFGLGFDEYRHAPMIQGATYRFDMAATVDSALEWIDSLADEKPFFLFLHTNSVHGLPLDHPAQEGKSYAPYHKPEPYQSRYLNDKEPEFVWRIDDRRKGILFLRDVNNRVADGDAAAGNFAPGPVQELKAFYDAGIFYVDEQTGRLMSELEKRKLDDSTVVIITSDHGEAFLEHGLFLHMQVYDDLLHVPLIMHDPRTPKGATVQSTVNLEDIAPTIVDIAGLPPLQGLDGISILPGREIPPDRPHFAYYHFRPGWHAEGYSLEQYPWKLVHHKLRAAAEFSTELYNLRKDPNESRVIDDEKLATALRKTLFMHIERLEGRKNISITKDPELTEHLRALGYVE
jgi:arylsulfatase A-like enzyme